MLKALTWIIAFTKRIFSSLDLLQGLLSAVISHDYA